MLWLKLNHVNKRGSRSMGTAFRTLMTIFMRKVIIWFPAKLSKYDIHHAFEITYEMKLIDVWSWWRHQMETFSALLAICAGNSPVNSPHKGQWRGALMFSLIYTRINCWVNNGEAGDLRRHRAHYDVTVMFYDTFLNNSMQYDSNSSGIHFN